MKLTQKQQTFTRHIFEGKNQSDAYKNAGYAVAKQTANTIAANASRLANNVNVKALIEQMNQEAEDESLAKVLERRQRLTTFIREDNYNKFGINRQGNIQAIAELNKMEKVYEEKGSVVDNRTINVIVNSEDGKEIINRLASGERTEKK